MDLFKDIVPSINEKTKYLGGGDTAELEKSYPAFMVNRALSQFADTIAAANLMNIHGNYLDVKMQYDFLYHAVRKKKRFGAWAKPVSDANINTIMEVFKYSRTKAEEAMKLLTEEDLTKMNEYLYKGGKNGK